MDLDDDTDITAMDVYALRDWCEDRLNDFAQALYHRLGGYPGNNYDLDVPHGADVAAYGVGTIELRATCRTDWEFGEPT